MATKAEGWQATCSVCGASYVQYREPQPGRGFCGNTCSLRATRERKIKAAIRAEFHGVEVQFFHPVTGEPGIATTVKLTDKGWALVGRWIAKDGETAMEWVNREVIRPVLQDFLKEHGLETAGNTIVTYPKGKPGS